MNFDKEGSKFEKNDCVCGGKRAWGGGWREAGGGGRTDTKTVCKSVKSVSLEVK